MAPDIVRKPSDVEAVEDEEEIFPLNPINGKSFSEKEMKPEDTNAADEMSEEEDIESFSDIVGETGPYHNRILILFVVSYLTSAFQNYGITFYSETPDYWCKSESNLALIQSGVNNSGLSTCTISRNSNETCTEFEFDHSFYRSTIVTEVSGAYSTAVR